MGRWHCLGFNAQVMTGWCDDESQVMAVLGSSAAHVLQGNALSAKLCVCTCMLFLLELMLTCALALASGDAET